MNTNKLIITVSSIALAGSAALSLLSEASHTLTVSDYEARISHYESRIEVLQNEIEELSAAPQESIEPSKPTLSFEYSRSIKPIYDLPLDAALQHYTYEMCRYYDIEEHYATVLGLMWRESNFNPEAISSTNDYGIMQINECNHDMLKKELGIVDIMNVTDNIDSGIYILSGLLNKYNDAHKALMAYNMGPSGAAALWNKGIYTSAYSRDVMLKAERIQNNKYFSE